MRAVCSGVVVWGEPQHLLSGTFTIATSPISLLSFSHLIYSLGLLIECLGRDFHCPYIYNKCTRLPYMGPASNLANSSPNNVALKNKQKNSKTLM